MLVCYELTRKSREVIPVRVPQGVVAVEVRKTCIRSTVVQVPEGEPKNRTPAKHNNASKSFRS